MGDLTTHVLDTYTGKPGAAVTIRLFSLGGGSTRLLGTFSTNDDGRCEESLLEGDAFTAGEYQLEFDIGSYYSHLGVRLPEPHFLNTVVIRFSISDPASHYHVPLVVTPWGYSTYRGS